MNRTTTLVAVGGAAVTVGLALKAYRNQKKKRGANSGEASTINKDTFASHVTDHDGRGLVVLSPGVLWHVTAKFKGNGPPWRRMIIYRPPGTSSLIVLSPTAVSEDVMSAIEGLGSVDILIVPNSYHRTDAAVFKERYPNAKVACPPGWVRKGVAQVVDVDMDAREISERFKDSVRVVRIGGLCNREEAEGDFEYAYEFKCAHGAWAYAVTDTLFNFREGGFMNWVFGCQGVHRPDGTTTPRVGRISRWFMHSRAECAEFYRGMAERDDVDMILLAHGNILVGGAKEAFSVIAEDLMR